MFTFNNLNNNSPINSFVGMVRYSLFKKQRINNNVLNNK